MYLQYTVYALHACVYISIYAGNAYYLCVCVCVGDGGDEVQDVTQASSSHPLCLLSSLSISCSYRADFIILLGAGRLPVTNWDG